MLAPVAARRISYRQGERRIQPAHADVYTKQSKKRKLRVICFSTRCVGWRPLQLGPYLLIFWDFGCWGHLALGLGS